MVSALSPIQAQGQAVDITGALLGGRQAYQQNQMNQQAMQQNAQQIERADYERAVERLKVINRLATKVKQLPQDQRASFVGSINQNMLQSVGIDPAQVTGVPLDDQSLDALIAQTGASIPESAATAGQREFESLTEGLSPAERERARRIELGLDPRAVGSANITTATTGLTEDVARSQAEIDRARSQAKADVKAATEPKLQAEITRAREEASAAVEKRIAQQGQMGKLEDAENVYNRMRDSDLDIIYGQGEKWYPEFLRSQRGIDLIADRDQLIGMLQLGARGELKGQGPITDSEQKILSNAVTVLGNPNIGAEKAKTALDDAMKILRRNAGAGGATPGIAPSTVTSKYKIEVVE